MSTGRLNSLASSSIAQTATERFGDFADQAAETVEETLGIDMEQLAAGLGWFSIGFGLAEVLAPRSLRQQLGLRGGWMMTEAFGWREVITGIGLLRGKNRAAWMWGRVGGDLLDLAALAKGVRSRNPHRGALLATLAAVAGITAVDAVCAQTLSRKQIFD
jgi:hypothetical protein